MAPPPPPALPEYFKLPTIARASLRVFAVIKASLNGEKNPKFGFFMSLPGP